MCGILGVVRFGAPPTDAADIDVSGIRDRGPDNIGSHTTTVARAGVTLMHTRLAVIDRRPSSNQPFANASLALVVNGEIYNHRELRSETTNYAYQSASDCETALAVYDADGIGGLARLDGMFALALLDTTQGKLILHRDPIGKKPLFYYADDARFVFASNVTAVAANGPEALEVDPRQIDFYRRHGSVHPARSIYRNIVPVRPGETVTVDLQSGQVSVQAPDEQPHQRDAAEPSAIAAELEHLIVRAVEKRCADLERPVLVFSGGLDTTVLAEAMCRSSGGATLISLSQPMPFMRDEPYARYVARRLGKRIEWVRPWRELRVNGLSDRFETAIHKLDQPMSIPAYYFLSLLTLSAEQHGNVLFTGDGADEVLHGYVPFSRWIDPHAETEPQLEGLRSGPPPAVDWGPYGKRQGILDLVGHGMVKVDKATAENRMEARCPFLDRELMHFARSLPANYWRRGGEVAKWPLKELLTRWGYPRHFVHRKKLGFAYPFRALMLPLMHHLRNVVRSEREGLAELGVHDEPPSNVVACTRNFTKLWSLYVLARWYQSQKRAMPSLKLTLGS